MDSVFNPETKKLTVGNKEFLIKPLCLRDYDKIKTLLRQYAQIPVIEGSLTDDHLNILMEITKVGLGIEKDWMLDNLTIEDLAHVSGIVMDSNGLLFIKKKTLNQPPSQPETPLTK